MFYRIVLFALMIYGTFSVGPFRKMRPCNMNKCNFKKEVRDDPKKIFKPDFVIEKMNQQIKKQLSQIKQPPKLLIIPPPCDKEDWESGEVAWEPKEGEGEEEKEEGEGEGEGEGDDCEDDNCTLDDVPK